jgi:hypothetical protein
VIQTWGWAATGPAGMLHVSTDAAAATRAEVRVLVVISPSRRLPLESTQPY